MTKSLIATVALVTVLSGPAVAHDEHRHRHSHDGDAVAAFVFGTVFGTILGRATAPRPRVVYRMKRPHGRCGPRYCFSKRQWRRLYGKSDGDRPRRRH